MTPEEAKNHFKMSRWMVFRQFSSSCLSLLCYQWIPLPIPFLPKASGTIQDELFLRIQVIVYEQWWVIAVLGVILA